MNLQAHFNEHFQQLLARWPEKDFVEAYLGFEADPQAAVSSISPPLMSDLMAFRAWYRKLCLARDNAAPQLRSSDEVRFFDQAFADAIARHSQPVDRPEYRGEIKISTWRGSKTWYMRVSGSNFTQAYRFGPEVQDAVAE